MTRPTRPVGTPTTLDTLTMNIRYRIPDLPGVAATLTAEVTRDDRAFITDSAVLALRAKLLAERLPPQTHNHVFDLNKAVPDPRWATWWDHLKATVRDRWWARAWVRRHPPRTVDTTVRVIDRYVIPVTVHSWWTYPHASIVPPDLGHAVLYTETTSTEWGTNR